MNVSYHLSGTFVEACNCTLVCPCWVDDEPSEDFCAGLFAWTFAPGSTIEGHDVGDRHVVSATVHGDARRGDGSESAIFVDERLDRAVADLLVTAFAGRGGGPLADLAEVTGEHDVAGPAAITVAAEGAGFGIRVVSGGTQVVAVDGRPRRFDSSAKPLTLAHTALSHELGIGDAAVTAAVTRELALDVAALPGPPIEVEGRSGMTGPFRYDATGADEADADERDAEAAGERDDGRA